MTSETKIQPNVKDTALLIPCYKSANLIAATLEAALKIFPPSHIFVLANGNSPTPLDNTEEIVRPYGVTHLWSPVGSKIVAQFVGCYAAKRFKNVLLIDDDCALPENFPVVTDRLVGKVKCIGYTIKSVGPNSSKGNFCQQAQDLEYKLSGLQREFAGKLGSATFPHGAISLWDRELLVKTFYQHPGFSVSEDWFFGHAARQLGCRITMCSQVFVETETPTAVFISGGGSRGGFGEMTIFSQRFKRWNFFFVNGMWYNLAYILFDWKLGWWEIGAKIFVFQEVSAQFGREHVPDVNPVAGLRDAPLSYDSLCFAHFVLCPALVLRNLACCYSGHVPHQHCHFQRSTPSSQEGAHRLDSTFGVLPTVQNHPHFHQRSLMLLVGRLLVLVFYQVYSNSLDRSLWKYARYFAKRHPKVVEDEKAVEVVVRLEESEAAKEHGLGRQLTVRAVNKTSEMREMTVVGMHAEPEPIQSGMSTPTRKAEGIQALDFSEPQRLQVNNNSNRFQYSNSAVSSSESLASEREVATRRLL